MNFNCFSHTNQLLLKKRDKLTIGVRCHVETDAADQDQTTSFYLIYLLSDSSARMNESKVGEGVVLFLHNSYHQGVEDGDSRRKAPISPV